MSRYQINVIRTGHTLVDCLCMTDDLMEYGTMRRIAERGLGNGDYTEVNMFTPLGWKVQRLDGEGDSGYWDDEEEITR